jgi:hypothetical protein
MMRWRSGSHGTTCSCDDGDPSSSEAIIEQMVVTHAHCSDMDCYAWFELVAEVPGSLASATCNYCGSLLQEGPVVGHQGPQLERARDLGPGEIVVETIARPRPWGQ